MISIIIITVLVLAGNVRMEICNSILSVPIIDLKTKDPVDIQKVCGNGTKPCVLKCCPENEVLFKIPYKISYLCINPKDLFREYNLTAISGVSDYPTIKTPNDKEVSFFEDFHLIYSDRFVNNPCAEFALRGYLRENGSAYWDLYGDNSFKLEFVAATFCMDLFIGFISEGLISNYAYHFIIDEPSHIINITLFHVYGGLVSAFFLLLVLVVHCLLKFLHGNPKGKLLMGFVFNMMLYFVYKTWYSFNTLKNLRHSTPTGHSTIPACKWVSPIGYYVYVAAFFWLNAMCYDIWRKFRSSKLKSLDDNKKMRLYSVYAVGMPLLSTIICLLIEQYGSERIRPSFHNCQEDDDNNVWKRLYVRLPTGLVVLSNVVMWVLTVRNVHRVRVAFVRSSRNSTHTRKNEKLSNVYRKLFILMGVNWLIEIIVTPIPHFEDGVYYIVVVPNTLLGLWIFLATVCNKDIFVMLCRRFGLKNKWTQNTNTTQVSQMTSISRPKIRVKKQMDSKYEYNPGQSNDLDLQTEGT